MQLDYRRLVDLSLRSMRGSLIPTAVNTSHGVSFTVSVLNLNKIGGLLLHADAWHSCTSRL